MAHGLRVKPDGTAPTRGREAFVLSVPCMAYCILTVPPYVSSPVFEWRGLVYRVLEYLEYCIPYSTCVCVRLSIVSTVMEIVLQLAKRSIVSIFCFEMFMKGYEKSPIESHSAFAHLSRL